MAIIRDGGGFRSVLHDCCPQKPDTPLTGPISIGCDLFCALAQGERLRYEDAMPSSRKKLLNHCLRAGLCTALISPLWAGEVAPPPTREPAKKQPAAKAAPAKPVPQVDFGVQWRAQNDPNRSDLTGNTADSIRSTVPGATRAGSGVSGGVQFRW